MKKEFRSATKYKTDYKKAGLPEAARFVTKPSYFERSLTGRRHWPQNV
ncbi:hypothetical protein predicted by Glimmer/Critica [Acetobacter senegalensis]|uniref:Uncharacterized protein n=1 Tax=Acetobacter senegalensis TaxID=446692 RepID=A0A0U5EVJ5_9PROT|nr:hypothetical protein predicted by Glimmer/Critica [Acetobacter senegalensis]